MKLAFTLPKIPRTRNTDDHAFTNKLIAEESKIGGQLFGPVPAGHRREFFCLDEHTWIWHEEWKDEQGKHQSLTTRYNVRPDGILKSQGSNPYSKVSFNEAATLYHAVCLYEQQVDAHYEQRLQQV